MIHLTEEQRKEVEAGIKRAREEYLRGEYYALEEAKEITTKKLEKFFSKHSIK